MSTTQQSHIRVPAADVITWCDTTLDKIKAGREQRQEQAVVDRLQHLRHNQNRWKRLLPRFLYNPSPAERADALASFDIEDRELSGSFRYWAKEYAWKSEKICKRIRALARTADKIGSPVFLTTEDHRHVQPWN